MHRKIPQDCIQTVMYLFVKTHLGTQVMLVTINLSLVKVKYFFGKIVSFMVFDHKTVTFEPKTPESQ